MSVKRFFIYSFAVHIFIIAAVIFSIPAVKGKKGGEFFTRLISPEEFLSQKPIIPPFPETRIAPHTLPGSTMPAPIVKDNKNNHREFSHAPLLKKYNPPNPPLEKGGKGGFFIKEGLERDFKGGHGGFSGETKIETGSKENILKPDNVGIPLMEKLFDRSIIGDLAKRDIEKEEGKKNDKTFTFDTKGYKFLIYNKKLKERIESIWVYPPDAAAKGLYGDLVIKFTIKKNGRLGPVELIRTSGHENLDNAAMKALRDGEPYWPLPEEWGMEAYTIVGHFIYTIYGYYVM